MINSIYQIYTFHHHQELNNHKLRFQDMERFLVSERVNLKNDNNKLENLKEMIFLHLNRDDNKINHCKELIVLKC